MNSMSIAEAIRPDLEPLFAEADAAVRVGNFPAGREGYARILEADPDSIGARVGLEFVAYVETGRKSRFNLPIEPIPERLHLARLENERSNEAEYQARRTRLLSFPSTLTLEHTTRCNFYCRHCSKGYEPYVGADLPRDLLDKVLDSLLPHAIRADITGFGEPTIGSEYGHLLERLVEAGVAPKFNTNASTLTLPHIELLVRAQGQITLSIDGATRETFEGIRAGGNWDRLMYTLHAVQRVRSIYQTAGWWGVTFVATRKNIHELPEMVRLVKRFGFDQLLAQDYQPFDVSFDTESLRGEPERANRFLDESESLARELGVELITPVRYIRGAPSPVEALIKKLLSTKRVLPKRGRFPQGCSHPWREARVNYRGEVNPCCFSWRKLGDIKERPFHKIWNGWRYRLFRWRIHTLFPPPECRLCHGFDGINRGNPGNTKLQEGILLKVLYRLEGLLERVFARRGAKVERPNYFLGKHWDPEEGTARPVPK